MTVQPFVERCYTDSLVKKLFQLEESSFGRYTKMNSRPVGYCFEAAQNEIRFGIEGIVKIKDDSFQFSHVFSRALTPPAKLQGRRSYPLEQSSNNCSR